MFLTVLFKLFGPDRMNKRCLDVAEPDISTVPPGTLCNASSVCSGFFADRHSPALFQHKPDLEPDEPSLHERYRW